MLWLHGVRGSLSFRHAMYLAIQYEGECEKHVVTHDTVCNFEPDDIDDYDKGKLYEAFWEGDEKTKCGYYRCRILYMAGELIFVGVISDTMQVFYFACIFVNMRGREVL